MLPLYPDSSFQSRYTGVLRLFFLHSSLLMDLESEASGENFLLVPHGDVLQILLAVCAGRPASQHRSITHLETAEIRFVVFG
jgi:broad specificity phosphatase PhoE